MAKEKNALQTLANVSAEIGLDKDDIVAIKVAKVETDLIKRQHEHEAKRRDLQKNLKQLKEDLDAAVKAVGEKTFDASDALKALKSLGFKLQSSTGATFDEKEGKITVKLCISEAQSDGFRHYALNTEKTIKAPKQVTDIRAKIDDLVSQLEEVQNVLIEVRKRLSQISTLERQAKAAITLAAIGDSEEGKALIKALDSIEGLPGIEMS